MEIKLTKFQDDFVYSPAKFPAFVGGWGTGKTLCGILRALHYSELVPGNVGIIFRKQYTDLRDSTIIDFKEYTGLKINSRRECVFPNKSVIMFRHIEELNNLQNVNLGWFMIEQADELETDNEFFMLWGRLRKRVYPDTPFRKLGLPSRSGFIIANVGPAWIKNIWKDNTKIKIGEIRYKQGINNMLSLGDFHLTEATTFDNRENLPDDFIDRIELLQTLKPEIYQRFAINDWSAMDDSMILIPQNLLDQLKGGHYRKDLSKVITVDPAAGGDEAVIYALKNNTIVDKDYSYEKDTMRLVSKIMLLSEKNSINNIAIDCIGIGKGASDRLSELGKKVLPINSASSSHDKMFLNLRSEMWWKTMEAVREREMPFPTDDELVRQLTSIRYKVSKGKILIEEKEKIRKSLGRSPDRADAFVMGIYASDFFREAGVNYRYRPYQYKQVSSLFR